MIISLLTIQRTKKAIRLMNSPEILQAHHNLVCAIIQSAISCSGKMTE
ncbi:hypothetical protein [Morganella psychrotolerans]|nr:hypothetical protein [Morganella psychrotolerans]